MICFGPIPSRRLGRSLGINNIPFKVCSYSCVYCQVGLTDSMSIERKEFYPPDEILNEVYKRVDELKKSDEKIDYISFVPDGEPTLDINLGKEIDLVKQLGIKTAVITNSSLLNDKKVRADLLHADWVSVKIDSTDEKIWHKIDRPNGKLSLERILYGIKAFAKEFKEVLVTETMLVKGLNDNTESIKAIVEFIKNINPSKAYILVPVRPPAEEFVDVPDEKNLNLAYQVFSDSINEVELLAHSGGTDFAYSSDAEKELVSIMAVHPMSYEAVHTFLSKAGANWQLIESLIHKNILKEVEYLSKKFLVRNVRHKIEV